MVDAKFIAVLNALMEHTPQVRLVILDSIAFHMRQDIQDASTKQHILANMFQLLTKTAFGKKCAVSVAVLLHLWFRQTNLLAANDNRFGRRIILQ